MREPQFEDVAQRLTTFLAEERRKAVVYSLLTVLCTPAFVAIASVVVFGVMLLVIHESDCRIANASAIYLGMTVFLASVVGMMGPGARCSDSRSIMDRAWLAGTAVFLLLLAVTYLTPLDEKSPVVFGIVYSVLGLLVLGLVGRAYLTRSPDDPLAETPTLRAFVLAVMGFVASAYAELLSVSWLWVAPKPHEIRVAAHVLCRLGADGKGPLHECVVDDRIERLLIRLKLLQRTDRELRLTPQGLDFVRTGMTIDR